MMSEKEGKIAIDDLMGHADIRALAERMGGITAAPATRHSDIEALLNRLESLENRISDLMRTPGADTGKTTVVSETHTALLTTAVPVVSPAKRGRKPKAVVSIVEKIEEKIENQPKKRGPKPKSVAAEQPVSETAISEKSVVRRGRKPKDRTSLAPVVTLAPADAPKKRGRKPASVVALESPEVVVIPETSKRPGRPKKQIIDAPASILGDAPRKKGKKLKTEAEAVAKTPAKRGRKPKQSLAMHAAAKEGADEVVKVSSKPRSAEILDSNKSEKPARKNKELKEKSGKKTKIETVAAPSERKKPGRKPKEAVVVFLQDATTEA
jgi:hypothetical protein